MLKPEVVHRNSMMVKNTVQKWAHAHHKPIEIIHTSSWRRTRISCWMHHGEATGSIPRNPTMLLSWIVIVSSVILQENRVKWWPLFPAFLPRNPSPQFCSSLKLLTCLIFRLRFPLTLLPFLSSAKVIWSMRTILQDLTSSYYHIIIFSKCKTSSQWGGGRRRYEKAHPIRPHFVSEGCECEAVAVDKTNSKTLRSSHDQIYRSCTQSQITFLQNTSQCYLQNRIWMECPTSKLKAGKKNRNFSHPRLKIKNTLPSRTRNSQYLVHVNLSILELITENTICKHRLPHNTFPDKGNVLHLVLAFTIDPSS